MELSDEVSCTVTDLWLTEWDLDSLQEVWGRKGIDRDADGRHDFQRLGLHAKLVSSNA